MINNNTQYEANCVIFNLISYYWFQTEVENKIKRIN